MSAYLTNSQYDSYISLPKKSTDELKKMYKEYSKMKSYCSDFLRLADFSEEDDMEVRLIADQYMKASEIVYNIEIELVRRMNNFEVKNTDELMEISMEATRRRKKMEKKEWEMDEFSSEENRATYLKALESQENLESAANLEIERRHFHQINPGKLSK